MLSSYLTFGERRTEAPAASAAMSSGRVDFDWEMLAAKFPCVADHILSHLTFDELDACEEAGGAFREYLRRPEVRQRLEKKVLRLSWLTSPLHTYSLVPPLRQRKVDYWAFDRGELFLILRDYRLQVYDTGGLRGELGVGSAADHRLEDCQEFFLAFTSDLVLLHVRFRQRAHLIRRRTLEPVVRPTEPPPDPPSSSSVTTRLLLDRAVGERVFSVFERTRDDSASLLVCEYGGGDAPYSEVARLPDCHPGCRGLRAEEISSTHFARACDHGHVVLADLADGSHRTISLFPCPHPDSALRSVQFLRFSAKFLAATFSDQTGRCLAFAEPLRAEASAPLALSFPTCPDLPDNVDGTCVALTDRLLVVSCPLRPDLQCINVVDLRTGRQSDAFRVNRSYVDMIHVVADRMLLFVCHRDPNLFDFGGSVHLLGLTAGTSLQAAATGGAHRVLSSLPMTMYSRMSDLPNHSLHVCGGFGVDVAFVVRTSMADAGELRLVSAKKIKHSSWQEGKFFDTSREADADQNPNAKCQVM